MRNNVDQEQDLAEPLTYEQAEAILREMARAYESAEPVATARVVEPVRSRPIEPIHSERTFASLVESSPDALLVMTTDLVIVLANAQTEELFGYTPQELCGNSANFALSGPGEMKMLERLARADGSSLPVRGLELYGHRKVGRQFPVELSLNRVELQAQVMLIATVRDITERKRLEARYRTLIEEIPAVTFMAALDESANELYVSPQIETLLGYSQQEWLEDPVLWYTRLHPEDRDRWHHEFAHTCATARPFRSVYRFIARDGRVVWVHGEAKMVRDAHGQPLFLQGVAFDITDRKNAEEVLRRSHEELEQQVRLRTTELSQINRVLEEEVEERRAAEVKLTRALREKEVLLREIHHRVKNNLQMISSLLRLQSSVVHDAPTQEVLAESQSRIRSVALIYERLYRSADLSEIDLGKYLRELVDDLARSYGRRQGSVQIQVDGERVLLEVEAAIPCGMIVTELVSNCYKHAFPEGRSGTVQIQIDREGEDLLLRVRDDGVGVPPGFDYRTSDSLGLQLVMAHTEQLRGTMSMTSNEGTICQVRFRYPDRSRE